MRELKRSQIKDHREALTSQQRGVCALCGLPFLPGQHVLDHDHKTNLVRGVIHRSCNTVLGRVENGARYGRGFDAIAFAKGVAQYLTKTHDGVLYPPKPKRRKK